MLLRRCSICALTVVVSGALALVWPALADEPPPDAARTPPAPGLARYEPFGDRGMLEPYASERSARRQAASDGRDYRPFDTRLHEAPVAVTAAPLWHPVERRVRDLRLSVDGVGSWTLVSAVAVAVAEIDLGAPGVALELTAAHVALDPSGPLESVERVYVSAGRGASARARVAGVAEVVCHAAVRCTSDIVEDPSGVLIGLVHVVPEGLSRPALLSGAWHFQMTPQAKR